MRFDLPSQSLWHRLIVSASHIKQLYAQRQDLTTAVSIVNDLLYIHVHNMYIHPSPNGDQWREGRE